MHHCVFHVFTQLLTGDTNVNRILPFLKIMIIIHKMFCEDWEVIEWTCLRGPRKAYRRGDFWTESWMSTSYPGGPGKKGIQLERRLCLKHSVNILRKIADCQRPISKQRKLSFILRTLERLLRDFNRGRHTKTWARPESGIKWVRDHMQGRMQSPRDVAEGRN